MFETIASIKIWIKCNLALRKISDSRFEIFPRSQTRLNGSDIKWLKYCNLVSDIIHRCPSGSTTRVFQWHFPSVTKSSYKNLGNSLALIERFSQKTGLMKNDIKVRKDLFYIRHLIKWESKILELVKLGAWKKASLTRHYLGTKTASLEGLQEEKTYSRNLSG